jgi:hypothetical protein
MSYTYYIYFLRNKNRFALFAWFIRLGIKRPYNHVELVAVPSEPYLPVRFYGAVSPRSRLTGQKEIDKNYDLVMCVHLKDYVGYGYVSNIKYLDALCGKPYSYAQILLQALSAVSYFLKRSLGRAVLDHEHKLICTELVARFMGERLGYKFNKSYDACEFKDLLHAKDTGAKC